MSLDNRSIIKNINDIEIAIKKLKNIYESEEYNNKLTTHPSILSLWENYINSRIKNTFKNFEDFLKIYDKIDEISDIKNEIMTTLFILNYSRDLNI
jgi:hypothetical protein